MYFEQHIAYVNFIEFQKSKQQSRRESWMYVSEQL